jgi:glyoxylase-like metal-dependent hydrolase (beta-lactamase superfamily II)
MKVQTFVVGMLETNCYVARSIRTSEAIIIDPGFESRSEVAQIIDYIKAENLKIKFIVNTHGHSDHVSGNLFLKKKYQVLTCVHEKDAAAIAGFDERALPADVLLKDNDDVQFGDEALKVLHTPGHSAGSICLLSEKLVFTGDTLFAGGIGRSDMLGGSERDMKSSLEKLLRLPDGLAVYPGHGPVTSIGVERRVNPFLSWL